MQVPKCVLLDTISWQFILLQFTVTLLAPIVTSAHERLWCLFLNGLIVSKNTYLAIVHMSPSTESNVIKIAKIIEEN